LIAGQTLCDTGAEDCDLGVEVSAVDDVNGGTMVWEFAKPIRRYDSAGRRLADLGRKGKGPGEYDIAVAASATQAGIKVMDVASLRVARFDARGGFLDFTPVRNVPRSTLQLLFLAGDAVVFSLQPLGDGSGSAFRAIRFRDDGRNDTLALQTMPGVTRAGQFYEMPSLFGPRPLWAMSADGTVLFTPATRYEVTAYRDGIATRRLSVEHQARPVEQQEIDREGARMRARAGPLRDAVEDAIRRAAAVHPAITQLFTVPDGGILVRESPELSGDSVRWSRFDSAWKVRGYVMLPESSKMLLLQPERMLVMDQLENGVRLQWYALP
jgi:hypothetical protein